MTSLDFVAIFERLKILGDDIRDVRAIGWPQREQFLTDIAAIKNVVETRDTQIIELRIEIERWASGQVALDSAREITELREKVKERETKAG